MEVQANLHDGAELLEQAIEQVKMLEDDRQNAIAYVIMEKFEEVTQTSNTVAANLPELLSSAFKLSHGEAIESKSAFSWLRAFERDERQELVLEVSAAHHKAAKGADNWANLEAVIHEWNESVLAILSDDLTRAWKNEVDEVLLTMPTAERIF